MRSLFPPPKLVGSMLACVAMIGCQHDRNCPTCGGLPRAQVAAAQVTPMPLSSYAAVPPGPVVHETLKPAPMPEAAASDRQDWQTVSGKVQEKMLDRRTFNDLTANPAFAHASDYSWLIGELRALGPGVWTVRFASVDEDRDTVVLVDAPAMNDMRTGQLVRVEGELVDPTSHDAKPSYRVNSIRPFEHN
jgi:hypothetical protein